MANFCISIFGKLQGIWPNEIKLPKVLITTVPFGDKSRLHLELVENAEIEYQINPFNKK